MTNFQAFNNSNQISPYANQLKVSQSYFPVPGGYQPTSTTSGGYNPWMGGNTSYAPSVMPWGSQSLFGQGALPSSVMQGGTYALGPTAYGQSYFGQPVPSAAYSVSPQAGGYMPMNSIPGLSSYPGAFSVRPQGPSYGYSGGDQFISGPYTGGYDVTSLYNQPSGYPVPGRGYPSLNYPAPPRGGGFPGGSFPGARRSNPFNTPRPSFDASRYFVSPDELQNGFDFGLSSILNNKPGSLSSVKGFDQFVDDVSFLTNDDIFSKFLDSDTGPASSANTSSDNLDAILAGFLGTGKPNSSSDDLDTLFTSVLGTNTPPTDEDIDPEIAALLAAFKEEPPVATPAPAPATQTAAAPAPAEGSSGNNNNGGYGTF